MTSEERQLLHLVEPNHAIDQSRIWVERVGAHRHQHPLRRILLAEHALHLCTRARRPERIDRRSLEAQGARRKPTIHEGPRSRAMKARGAQPLFRRREVSNRQGARGRRCCVDYPKIDDGRSRPDYNRQIESLAELWQAVDADRQRREFAQLAHHQEPGLPEGRKAAALHGAGNAGG
ncbi:MAG: MobA/MobL family protein [Roseococcus sp.]|nr:MobA/MobL family protein [Roseococcus sp.]